MQNEWRVWFGFIAVVLLAVVFVMGRDGDDKDLRSQLSAGTSQPTSAVPPPTTATTTVRPTTTSSSSSTSTSTSTTPPTTRRAPPATEPTEPDTAPLDTTPATAPSTTPAPQRIQFGPGTYRIGIDLPAGIYRTDGGQSCFWARLSSLSGSADSVIAGAHTNGSAATVGIDPADAAFTTEGCAAWVSL